MFAVRFSSAAQRNLKKFAKRQRRRILDKIFELKAFPGAHLDIKKLVGVPNAFRLRIADIRVLFLVHWEDGEILVYTIGNRRSIY